MIKSFLIFATSLFLQPGGQATQTSLMPTSQDAARLTVTITGVEEQKGKLQVALFNTAEGYPDKAKPYKAKVIDVTGGDSWQAVFEDLPAGDYAVAVYHDKNGNGKLDKNLVGIPVEDYGFSNDTRGTRMSAPSFEDTKMAVSGGDAQVAIEVR